jgi:hypothetical protein
MSDWIGLGVIVLLGVLALVGLARLGTPRKEMTVEEFEERARTGGHTRAGMFALQEILDPKAAKAVEVQQDLKHGYYNKKRVPGDGDDEENNSDGGENDGGDDEENSDGERVKGKGERGDEIT